MKNVKMSLANIQGKLSRKELKNIMAGSGDANGTYCQLGTAAKVYCYNGGGCNAANANGVCCTTSPSTCSHY